MSCIRKHIDIPNSKNRVYHVEFELCKCVFLWASYQNCQYFAAFTILCYLVDNASHDNYTGCLFSYALIIRFSCLSRKLCIISLASLTGRLIMTTRPST